MLDEKDLEQIREMTLEARRGAVHDMQVIELPLSAEEQAQFHSCCEGIRRNMQHLKEL